MTESVLVVGQPIAELHAVRMPLTHFPLRGYIGWSALERACPWPCMQHEFLVHGFSPPSAKGLKKDTSESNTKIFQFTY
jgi:hypothetical protein